MADAQAFRLAMEQVKTNVARHAPPPFLRDVPPRGRGLAPSRPPDAGFADTTSPCEEAPAFLKAWETNSALRSSSAMEWVCTLRNSLTRRQCAWPHSRAAMSTATSDATARNCTNEGTERRASAVGNYCKSDFV